MRGRPRSKTFESRSATRKSRTLRGASQKRRNKRMWISNWPTCYMTIGEAAAILGRHEQTLYRAARAGRFPVVRTFGSLRIDPATLTAWLQKRGADSLHSNYSRDERALPLLP